MSPEMGQTTDPTGPFLLAASPSMRATPYRESVIYLLDYREDGAGRGFFLNVRSRVRLRNVLQQMGFDLPQQTGHCFQGGPRRAEHVYALHESPPGGEDSEEMEPGVWLSGTPESMRNVVQSGCAFRMLLGYLQWGPGRLEAELARGTWLMVPSDPEYLFRIPDKQLWRTVLTRQGMHPVLTTTGRGCN